MAKQLNVDVNLNTAKAEAALKNLQQLLTQAIQGAGQGGNGALTKDIVKATQEAAKLKTMLASATDTKTGQLNLSKLNQQLKLNGTSLQGYSKSLMQLGPAGEKAFLGLAKSVVSTQAPVKQANTMLTQLGTTLKNTARWQLSSTMLHTFIGGIQNAFSYARGLNDSLNSIRIVTGQSADQMDRFAERANKAAKALSTSTLDYTDAALIYYQQGIRDDAEIKGRTDATIKMANVTGQSAQKVSEQMTAIWNNFAKGSTNLEYFADVITALGANTASSSAEISTGLQKFAAVADTVGLSYEYATSALATVVATTRQSADVVGTALKTLFARIQSLNLGETLEDGTTLGKYSKALSQVGIEIKDQSGELRSMDDILDDMGNKWETLNKDQQVALAQTVAGQRQYTQLVALMDNWDFMKENLKIAYDSEGTLEKQQEIYEESWKAARERVKASMQGLTTDLISDDFFIGFNDAIATAVQGLDGFIDALGGLPGLFGMIGVVATKFFGNQLGQRIDNVILKLKEMTGMASAEAQVMQQSMNTMMQKYAFNSTGVQGAENQAIQRSIQLSSMLLAKKEQLTQADIDQAQALIEVTEAYGRSTVAAAEAAEAADKNLIKERQLAEQRVVRNGQRLAQQQGETSIQVINAAGTSHAAQFKEQANALNNIITLSEKVRSSMSNIGSGGSSITQMTNSLLKLKKAYQQVGMSTKKIDKLNTNLANNSQIQAAIAAEKELAAAKKAVSEAEKAKANTSKITDKTAQTQAEVKANEQLATAKEKLAAAETKYQSASKGAQAVVSSYKTGIENQINMTEQYITALEKSGKITTDMASSLRQLTPAFAAAAAAQEEFIQKQQQEQMVAQRTAEAIKQMTASTTVSKMGQSMVGVLGTVSSLSMGISSLKSAVESLNNTELSFGEKFLQVSLSGSMGLSMLMTGLMGLPKAFAGIGAAASSGLAVATAGLTGVAKTALVAEDGVMLTGQALWTAALNGEKLSTVLTGLLLKALPVIATIAAIAAVIAAVVKVTQEAQETSPEGQLKTANQNISDMSTALMDAKSAAEELNSAFDKYDSVQDKLKSCTRGTAEWTEALKENNNEVLSLLSKFPELAAIEGGLIKNRDGSLSISNKAREELTKTADRNVETMTLGKLMAEERSAELSQSINNNAKLAGEIASEIIKGQQTDWGKMWFGYGTDVSKDSQFDIATHSILQGLFDNNLVKFKSQNQEAIGRREEGGNAPGWAQPDDALTTATNALVENFDQLSGKYGVELEQSLAQIFDKANIDTDVAAWARQLETSSFRDDLIKNTEAYQAQQKAFETSQIGLLSSKLATEGILENDSKTKDLVSTILGKQLDERTKSAVDEDKEIYNRGGIERQRLAEEYVKARGGDINSIEWDGNKFSYSNNEGQVFKDITGSMVASVTGAASALEELAGAASAAASSLQEIPRTEGGDAVRDFLENGDFTRTSGQGLKAIFGDQLGAESIAPNLLLESLISNMGGSANVEQLASFLGKTSEEFLADASKAALEANQWYGSDERKQAMMAISGSTGADMPRLENYSRAELETRQKYENSKIDRGPVKTLQELSVAAEAAGEAQEYLNRSWKDGTHLSGEQMSGLKNIISDAEQYALVIDESTGKVKDASLLNDMLNKSIRDVGVEAARAQVPLYDQLNSLYDELAANAEDTNNYSDERQAGILQEIELLEQEISKYKELAIAQSGAAQAYAKIAEGKEYDEAHDYTDELTGAVGSIYSHMEQDDDGNYLWSTLQGGSHEVQAALKALVPENVLHPDENTPSWMTPQQYIEFMYGNGKKDGRYRSKDGDVGFQNVQNFVQDALGNTSKAYGQDFTGFASNIDLKAGIMDLLTEGENGAKQTQISLKDTAESMHMTEAAFLSMITAMDKYNESGQSFLRYFNLEGAEFATQLEADTQLIKTAAEEVQAAQESGDDDRITKAYEQQEAALRQSAQHRKEAIEDAAQYKALVEERDALLKSGVSVSDEGPEAERLKSIFQQISDLESKGSIEIKLEFLTDENIIDNIKNTIKQAGEEGLTQTDFTGFINQLKSAEDPAKVLSETGLDKIFTDIDKLPTQLKSKVQAAMKDAGVDQSWIDDLLQGVEEAGDETKIEPEIDLDPITSAINDWKEANKEFKMEPTIEEPESQSGTSSYTGSTSNNPRFEGLTTGGSSGRRQPKQQQQQVQSQAATVTVDVIGTEKITAITDAIASIPATIPLSISGNITDVSDHIATLSGLLTALGGNVPTLTVNTNSSDVSTELTNLGSKAQALSSIKPRIMIQCNANSVGRSVSNLASSLRSLKSPPPIHISITADPVPSIPGINGAYGTARAYGSAFENGKWGTGMGPTPALVGELGQELVVDPATGRFYTVGDTGAEFVKLPKNAIVFNHRQTEGLLKNRKINSRGQAMAEGNTNQVKGLAFAAGTDETVQYQEKMLTIIRNEVDLFKEIEYQLSKINHELKNVQRNIGRLAGRDAFENIERTIQKLNELYKENLHARDYAIENNKLDKQALNSVLIQWEQQKEHSSSKAGERKYNTERAQQVQDAFKFLETYGKLSSDAYKRDANGVVTEYDKYAVEYALKEMARNAEITYNSAVKSETLTQQQQVEAENAYNYIMAGVEAIGAAFSNEQDTAEKIWEYTENAQDNLEEMHDLEAQRIKEEFELRKQLANNDIKRVELIMKRLDNNFFKRAEKLSFMFDKDHMFEPTDWAKNGTHTELGDRIKLYHAAIKQFEDAQAGLARGKANYQDPHAITEQQFMDLSQASIDELADFEEYLIDLIDTMRTYFADTLEQASNELEKYTDQMGHYVSVLDHMSNLMDLLGRKFDFDSKESIIRGQMNGLKNDLEVRTQMFEELDKNREEAEKHLAEHAAEYSKEAYEYEYNNLVLPSIQAAQEAEEKKYEAAEAYLEKLEALYQNAFDRINAEWEKLGTQGQGWDYLTGAMERAKAIQDEYLTTTNKLYETNTLMRKVQNDINKTDSSVSKEKLMNFNKEIEAAQQNDKLAKSSMEILKARYELLQAEMALEDAKNAKSTVRLQRDNEGNYGYVYTADQDDIDDKEQNFADKQNDLYNLVLGYQNDYQEKSMQAMQEFQTKWMELEQQRKDGLIASDTELYAKQEELKAQYQEIFDAYNISMTESEQWLNEIAAEGVSEAWAKSWEDRRGNLTDFMGFSNDAHTELNGYLKEMNDVRNEVVKDAKLGMDDVNKKVQELTTKSNTLKTTITETVIPAIGDEISAVRDLTEAFDEQYDHLQDLIDQVHNYLNVMSQAQVDAVGQEYQDDAYAPDWSVKMMEAAAAGDWESYEKYYGYRGTKIELGGGFDATKHRMTADESYTAIKGYAAQGMTVEQMNAAYQKDSATMHPEINVTVNVDKTGHGKIKYNGTHYADGHVEGERVEEWATGGYTGEWGSEGKIGILHEKELVLNKDDTSNLLKALKIAKENYMQSIQTQRLQSLYEQQMIASTEQFTSAAFQNNTDSLQQDVTIHAEFPNVTERNEIAEAFKTLVNEASQFANRY